MEIINNFILRFVYIIKLGNEFKLHKEEIQSMLMSNQDFLFKDFNAQSSAGMIVATVVTGIILGLILKNSNVRQPIKKR